MRKYLTISVILMLCELGMSLPADPMCSPFDYQLKTLETMLRTEKSVKLLMEEIKAGQESAKEELKNVKFEIKTEFDKLKTNTNKQLTDQKEKMESLATRAEERLQSVDNALAMVKNKPKDMTVAFSVNSPTQSIVNGVPTFKTAFTNTGGGYNVDTGVFTSPVDGLYMFVFSVASHGKNDVFCRIKHNGFNKAFGRTSSDNPFTTASTSVYLMLTKGDTVSLGGCGGWENSYTGHYDTSFSGVLFKQTSVN